MDSFSNIGKLILKNMATGTGNQTSAKHRNIFHPELLQNTSEPTEVNKFML